MTQFIVGLVSANLEVLHLALFTSSSNLWDDNTYCAACDCTHLEVLLVLLLCQLSEVLYLAMSISSSIF